jgi:hypothetical protein
MRLASKKRTEIYGESRIVSKWILRWERDGGVSGVGLAYISHRWAVTISERTRFTQDREGNRHLTGSHHARNVFNFFSKRPDSIFRNTFSSSEVIDTFSVTVL